MNYKNKIVSVFLLSVFALINLSCAKQGAEAVNANASNSNNVITVSDGGEKAKSPTEAYKMLFAACKAKDSERIKQLMSKSSLNLAQFNAGNQKITLEKSLENGLVAPTMAPALTQIRDERVKGNYGAVEVYNETDKRFEDLPFVLEDGGWKLAVGDIFQGTYQSPGKGQAEIENQTNMNKSMSAPMNKNIKMPPINGENKIGANESKSVEVPKEPKPKQWLANTK